MKAIAYLQHGGDITVRNVGIGPREIAVRWGRCRPLVQVGS
jgi:hypothetical protein